MGFKCYSEQIMDNFEYRDVSTNIQSIDINKLHISNGCYLSTDNDEILTIILWIRNEVVGMNFIFDLEHGKLHICFYNDYVYLHYESKIILDSLAHFDKTCIMQGDVKKYDELLKSFIERSNIGCYVNINDLKSFKEIYCNVFGELNSKNSVIFEGL